jgi:hypothetical protein
MMWPALLLLATAAAPTAEVQASAATPTRFVIVVGHNGAGDESRRPLAWADDDAARFYLQALPSARRGFLLTTFDRDTARAFPDLTDVARPPTRVELARVLGEVAWEARDRKSRGEATELVFYFAGHGDVDAGGEGFLVFSDGPFTRSDLETQVVDAAPTDQMHVILDACASYFMVSRGDGTESGRRALSPAMLDVLNKAGGARDRTGVLVSTSDAADVHESPRVGGGVFSYLLRSALAGGGDINGDGRVEYGEAAAFVEAASREIGDPRARLEVHAQPPAQRPHAALADHRGSGAEHFLRLEGRDPAHVQVLDARGMPLLEVHRGRGQDVTLALTGNPFYVVRIGEREAVLAPRRAGAYALSSLRFYEAAQPRSPAGPAFGGLFARPYDRSFVDGFLSQGDALPPRPGETFDVEWAEGGERPPRMPWAWVGTGALAGAAAAGAVAIGATVGNFVAFSELERSFEDTRSIDPEAALEVERWRAAAMGATVVAGALAAVGAGAFALELAEEEQP